MLTVMVELWLFIESHAILSFTAIWVVENTINNALY